jgi:hypothetical protein
MKMTREAEDQAAASEGSVALEPLDFMTLERAAGRGDLHSFMQAVQVVNWQTRSADEFAQAIQFALSLGAFAVA